MEGTKEDQILQKYFPNNHWGAVVGFVSGGCNDGCVDFVSIYKLSETTTNSEVWTAYATIVAGFNKWELSEGYFDIDDAFCNKWGEEYKKWIGTGQLAMYIYGYYSSFGAAIRNLAIKGVSDKGRKPVAVYV